jgi:hypothetical protein
MFAGFGSAEKTIITALHLTGFPLTVGEVVDAFPKSHARAIRNAAFSLAANGVVRLSDGRPMRICSAAPLAPQQPRPRPAPLAPQQPRPAPLAPQQPNLDLSPADALAARLAREIDRQKRDAATPRQTTV